MSADEARLDGNAAAGALASIFARDMTIVATTCGQCGTVADVGALPAYISAMGSVLRCAGCEVVLLRIVETPDRVWLDLTGMRSMALERHV
jgi:hypothetical protein